MKTKQISSGYGRKESCNTGYLAECFVNYELAKRKIRIVKVPDTFDYDFITQGGQRVEVKSARPKSDLGGRGGKTYHKRWKFMNGSHNWTFTGGTKVIDEYSKRDRNCDIFIFVCFEGDLQIAKVFIVPKDIIGDRAGISIPYEFKRTKTWNGFSLLDYENRWDLIK